MEDLKNQVKVKLLYILEQEAGVLTGGPGVGWLGDSWCHRAASFTHASARRFIEHLPWALLLVAGSWSERRAGDNLGREEKLKTVSERKGGLQAVCTSHVHSGARSWGLSQQVCFF